MALQSSGAISFSELQAEYGGSNPISINEYYRDGTYVPSLVDDTFTATATSTSVSSSFGSRPGYDSGPTFNGSNLYTHSRWSDGGAQSATITMTLPAGTYHVQTAAFLQSGGQYFQWWIKVSGTQVAGTTTYYYTYGTNTVTTEVTLTEETTLQVYNYQSALGNTWQANIVNIGGDTTSTRTVTQEQTVNQNVPTSGAIDMSDFYGGQKNYE